MWFWKHLICVESMVFIRLERERWFSGQFERWRNGHQKMKRLVQGHTAPSEQDSRAVPCYWFLAKDCVAQTQIQPTLGSVLSGADTQRNEWVILLQQQWFSKIQAEASSPKCSVYCPELVRKAVTADPRVKNQTLSISEVGLIFALQLWV